jgi:alpha-beta hydrolase superfamily lysophospholipase
MQMTQKTTRAGAMTALLAMLFLTGVAPAGAQDNSDGRYRPDGRQIAYEVSRMFGESVYEVRTYDPEPDAAEFSAASIFYPLTLSFSPPIGAIALVPGYRGSAENYEWWGPMLASFGYAVMVIDTNTPEDNMEARKQALIAAVNFLRAENDQADSPIQGRIDTGKIAILGHSLGGGASLRAADELGDQIGAVGPLMP